MVTIKIFQTRSRYKQDGKKLVESQGQVLVYGVTIDEEQISVVKVIEALNECLYSDQKGITKTKEKTA